jgi:hypothetical protein
VASRPAVSGRSYGVLAGELAKSIENRSGSSTPSISAWDGAITRLLLAEEKLDVVGVDNEPKMIEQARRGLRGATQGRQAEDRPR